MEQVTGPQRYIIIILQKKDYSLFILLATNGL
jgi:hypothetical protein